MIFRDVKLSMAGGGTPADAARVVPELVAAYPDVYSFGKRMPAYGFWIRHAEGILFQNVTVTPNKPDARPQFAVGEDATNVALPQ